MTPFCAFFDRVYIINLPSRPDRLASVTAEMAHLGITKDSGKIEVPEAPIMADAGGFPSKGVYGNFLSHLEICRDARDKGYERVMVLEDDAIFRHLLRDARTQKEILDAVESHDWTMWYPGHGLNGITNPAGGWVMPSKTHFLGAHCYCLQRKHIDAVVDYLDLTTTRPAGHPDGGRLYIDGAFNMFKDTIAPDRILLISTPNLSIQKGTQSDLGRRQGYDALRIGRTIAGAARQVRDDIWRRSGLKLL